MVMPGRSYSAGSGYRYGFNGKEDDKDISEGGQDYGMRVYDKRLGRFLSVDPLTKQYAHYTPYSFAGNKPIKYIDLDGAEEARNWSDYDIHDLWNWLGKPSNPFQDNGFVHSASSGLNRNFNPLYYGWVAITGGDPVSSDYAPMSRRDATANLAFQLVFHKSIPVLPTAAVVMEREIVANKAAMVSGGVRTAGSNLGAPVKTLLPETEALAGEGLEKKAATNGSNSINPWKEGTGGTMNCEGCAKAGDATLRGFPATALPRAETIGLSTTRMLDWFGLNSWTKAFTIPKIEIKMVSLGEGSQGVVYGYRPFPGVGHYYNAVFRNGETLFYDFQKSMNPIKISEMSGKGFTEFWFIKTK